VQLYPGEMRDDLLEAKAAVEWGISQLPVLQRRIDAWHEKSIEVVTVDLNPQTGKKAKVAREKEPIPLIVNAEVGAIIGSLRSSLDLLAAALAKRNGATPNRHMHFPIFYSVHDFCDPLNGLHSKKWLSEAEIRIIKKLKPYEGGNVNLWALHQLDILRKHERLIAVSVRPKIVSARWKTVLPPRVERPFLRLSHETVLIEFPADTVEPDVEATLDVIFDELGLGVAGRPVITILRHFATVADKIIGMFDA